MLFIEPEKTSLVVFYLAPSWIDLILFRLDMCSSHLCNTVYFLLTRGFTVLPTDCSLYMTSHCLQVGVLFLQTPNQQFLHHWLCWRNGPY
jgi:hypothetical protein